eukprot:147246-Heterocapsa_arctica.AAC.1
MKGGDPRNPPWRQEGKGCTPTGGHSAGAAASTAQIGAPNAGGWIYPQNMQPHGGAPGQPWMAQPWQQQVAPQTWDPATDGQANPGWQQYGQDTKGGKGQ